MRTTLDIQDQLLIQAKKRAAEARQTLTSFVEDALRLFFENQRRIKTPKPFKMRTVKGKLIPNLDINHTAAVLDFLDEGEYASNRRQHPDQRPPDQPTEA